MENNIEKDAIMMKKLGDPKFYLENFCKIKGKKQGSLVPFILNEAQKDLYNAVRNYHRVIILKARQIGFCGHPDTRVLTSDLRWVTLRDISIGQKIVSVDEHPIPGRGNSRKMVEAIVENKCSIFDVAVRLTMDDGREIIFTEDHRFLAKKRPSSSATEVIWKKVRDMNIGDEIRHITVPWDNPSYEDGWFSGMIDGEGSLAKKSRTGTLLTVSQVDSPVWRRMIKYVESNGINYRIEWDKRKSYNSSKFGDKPVGKIVIGLTNELIRCIGMIRPERFIDNKFWNGKSLPNNGWAKILKIEKLEKQEMIDLQTSKKTYIAEGFVSHNSTAMVGYYYHNTIMNPGTTTALIGYNSDLTAELLDKVKMFYKTTPPELRPTIHYNSKYEISFPRIDSKILVLPSTDNVGRGYTIHNCLATELSAWENAEEKMMTLEASVPIDGSLVIESTPRGQGNLYHRMWMQDNDYTKREYGWWWGYTEEEINTIRRRMNNPMRFAQEYGCEFLASGRSVFDANVLKMQRKNILKLGDKVKISDDKHFIVHEKDKLRMYKPPMDKHFYVCGVDVSEGVEGGDYSVAVIWDRATGEEVAMFRGLIPPDILATKLDKWGRMYNNALMVVEVNNHGLTTLTGLKQKIYPSLFFRPASLEKLGNPSSDKLGWKTTKMTRELLIDDLAQALREKSLTIHSKELLDEMSTFVYDDKGNMVSPSGFHDDCIFSAGIGFQGFKVMYHKPLNQINYNDHLPVSFSY